MAECPKCGWSRFAIDIVEPKDSPHKVTVVKCASCGAAIGTLDYYSAGVILKAHEGLLKLIAEKLGIYVGDLEY